MTFLTPEVVAIFFKIVLIIILPTVVICTAIAIIRKKLNNKD